MRRAVICTSRSKRSIVRGPTFAGVSSFTAVGRFEPRVPGPVDDAKTALAELLLERVLAHLPSPAHLGAKAVGHA
jgi:hypothetical protein